MLKQLLISGFVLIAAAAGYIYFVPGSDQTLRSLGVTAPVPTAYAVGADREQSAGQRGGGGRSGRPQVPTVITAPVATSTVNDRLTAIGQGTSSQSVNVTSQATGTLNTLLVSPGEVVKAGQIIAHLDSDAEQIAYDKAKLAVSDTSDILQRTETLAKTNNATTVALNLAKFAFNNATLELRNATLALDKRSIKTPIDGTVGLFRIMAGNAVAADTVVTTVDDTSSILVHFWVPERYAPVIKAGMPVGAEAIALPDEAFSGTISAVDSRIDPTSRTLEVEAKIPNAAGQIKPGMSFSMSMKFPGDTYPSVDPLAVQWDSDGAYVWLLTPDSKVVKQKVQIIQRNSDGVLVKGDLKPGQQVVTQGVLLLAEGATVRQLTDDAAGGGDKAASAPQPATRPANTAGAAS
ncbi:MAG TPA: efflux RND transporter periplasmic adaptor subunit [Devosiaceae bacterium]|nr:efflux RND transporter periplasmic adaptor subunit [Devosiaceae bacterium]